MKAKRKRISNNGLVETNSSIAGELGKRDSYLSPRSLFVILFLIVSVLGVYWQVRNHEFVTYDDNAYIYENARVQSGLTLDNIRWAFTTGTQANWHPLTWISHMVDSDLYGLNAGGHHFTGILLHTINTVLLFIVFWKMTGAFWPSAFVAAFFGLHPLHVESVAWAAERKDVLSTFFWMLTMLMYVRYVEKPILKRYVLVIVFFALGLMAKPMLVTLPFALLLLDFWPLRRFQFGETAASSVEPAAMASASADGQGTSFPRLLREKVPLFVLSVISSVVTFVAQQYGGAVFPLERMPITMRLGNAMIAYIAYIRKMIWPSDLAFFYPHRGYALQIWAVIISTALLLALTAFFVWLGRNRRYLVVGWLWYLGTLIPVIGIVQVGIQAMADRYTYISLIGLSIILAWGVPELLGSWRYKKLVLAGGSGASVLAMMTLTWFQVGQWRDSLSLFSHAATVTKKNYLALTDLGLAEAKIGKTDDAIAHYTEALRIAPNLWDIHNYLGMALASKGRIIEATTEYAEAVRLKPDYQPGHFNLGIALDRLGKTDDAITQFSESLRLLPGDAEAENNLGAALGKQGKIEQAIGHFSEALRIRPEYPSALYNLGSALVGQGKYEEAIRHLSEVVRLKPDHANAHYNLGLALDRVGRISEAMDQFDQAIRLNPTHEEARKELARLNSVSNQ